MRITALTSQQKNKDRVNVMVDGKYRFSLDIFQLSDLGVRIGKEYNENELADLEIEGQFGKLYARTLEYCLMRPHSSREVRDYLYRKTRATRTKTGGIRKGFPTAVTERVYDRLLEKGYIDDEKFARYWTVNRNLRKGMSRRKLQAELRAKGIESAVIDRLLAQSPRSDEEELEKIINKKRHRYPEEQKFIQYLVRQGFSYDSVKAALGQAEE